MTRGTPIQIAVERALGAEGQRRPHTWDEDGDAPASASFFASKAGVSRAYQRPCAEHGGLDRHRRESLAITRVPEETMNGALPEHRGPSAEYRGQRKAVCGPEQPHQRDHDPAGL